MEKTMLGRAGFLTAIRESGLSGMIDEVKGVEPETGYFLLVEMRTPPRGELVSRRQTSCLLLPISTGAIFGRSNAYFVIER
jgi:predicted molibdopterin-dependent oxidoreductase YjgC